MEERPVHLQMPLVADHQAAEVAQPGERPLHFPSPPVSPQLPSVLGLWPPAVLAVRAGHLDAPSGQPLTQRVAVVAPIEDQPLGLRGGPTARRDVDLIERRLQQLDLRLAGRVEVACQRKTFTIDHHHPLRALALLGLADPGPPFFAGANDPSAKHSSQQMRPSAFISSRNALHASSQMPRSSHSASRRQQVEGEGYPCGRAFQRPPLRSTQRMPSTTGRLGTGLGPPLGDGSGSGSSGASVSHISSVSSGWRMSMVRLRAMAHLLISGCTTQPTAGRFFTIDQL